MSFSKSSLIFALFFVLLSASAFAAVTINPSSPDTNNDLVCSPNQAGNFIYKWSLNNGVEQNIGNTVFAYQTTRNQVWTCRIYLMPSRYIPPNTRLGEVSVEIRNSNPVINSFVYSNGTEPATINFSATASDIDNDPLTYSWALANGTIIGNTAIAVYTFNQNGTYPVTLTVSDNAGGTATRTAQVVIADTVPVVDFILPNSAIEGTPVNFADNSTAYDLPINWSWTFGDGNTSTLPNPVNVYSQNGIYSVTLNVTDNDGSVVSLTKSITINDTVPTADAGFDTGDFEGQRIDLNGSLSTGYDQPLSYLWTLANGTIIGNRDYTNYTFYNNGTYIVTLTVTDNDGSVDTDDISLDVGDLIPYADFNMSSNNVIVNDNVTFTDLSYSFPDLLVQWTWDFGDLSGDTNQNATHSYSTSGNYTVNLTVTDDDGSTDTAAYQIEVRPLPIVIDNIAPATITWLMNGTITNSSITWNWTDPIDADFAGRLITVNGTPVINVSLPFPSTTSMYSLSGLQANTTYKIIVLTFDNATPANVNQTPISLTVSTLANPITNTCTPPVSGDWLIDGTQNIVCNGVYLNLNSFGNIFVNNTATLTIVNSTIYAASPFLLGIMGFENSRIVLDHVNVNLTNSIFARYNSTLIINNSVFYNPSTIDNGFATGFGREFIVENSVFGQNTVIVDGVNSITTIRNTTANFVSIGSALISNLIDSNVTDRIDQKWNSNLFVTNSDINELDNGWNTSTIFNSGRLGNMFVGVSQSSSNLSDHVTIKGNVSISGASISFAGNVTRYYPIFVYNTTGSLLDGIRLNITNGTDVLFSDLTVNGYVYPSIIFNRTTAYTDYQINVNGVLASNISLTTTTPMNLYLNLTSPISDIIPPILSNINVSGITNESVIINWTTDELADSYFSVQRPLGGFGGGSAPFVLNHSVSIGGLTANTTYNFTVRSCDSSTNCNTSGLYNFTTLPNVVIVLPSSEPNRTIDLSSLQNNSITSNRGNITLNGVLANLPGQLFIPNATYSLVYTPSAGFAFLRWNATNAIVDNNDTASANVRIIGNATIAAIYYNTSVPTLVINDVLISKTYIDNVNGVRLSDQLGANVTGNLTQGQSYTIGYRVDNNGTVSELTDSFIRVYNSTNSIVYTNSHSNNIAAGATSAHNTDSWNTSIWAPGLYTIEVNATIPVDSNILNNLGSRIVNLVSPAIIPVPDTTAPATITNLIVQNRTNSTITWSWTNPADADFAGTLVSINGAANITLPSAIFNITASSLLPANPYNIVIYTFDNATIPNINGTSVRNNTRTLVSPAQINTPPSFTTPAVNRIVHINSLFTYDVNASDVDFLPLTFSDNLTQFDIDANTGLINFTPSALGTINGMIRVCDISGLPGNCTTQSFNLNVQNNAPAFQGLGNVAVGEGRRLNFTVSAIDPDGDALTYSASGLPSWATFDAATRTFNGTPSFTQSGTYPVTFNVTDSYTITQQTITVTVSNVIQNGFVNGFIWDTVSGVPLSGATVQARLGTSTVASWLTDATGSYSFSLQPRTYNITAFKSGYVDNNALNVPVVEFGTALRNITLSVLITKGNLTGTVRDSNNAIYGALVELRQGAVTLDSVTTGADGKYTFNDKNIGPYTVVVSKSGFNMNTQSVSISAGTTTRDVTFVPSTTSGTISGTVRDGNTNNPIVTSTTVTIKDSNGNTIQIVNTAVGNFVINGLPATVSFTYDLDSALVAGYTQVFSPTGLGLAPSETKTGMDIYMI